MKNFAALLIALATFLSGCKCDYVCDCASPFFRVQYVSDSLTCPQEFKSYIQVQTFNAITLDSLGTSAIVSDADCSIEVFFRNQQFYIIHSNSLRISDTVRVQKVAYENGEDKCCNCGSNIVKSIELNVNGLTYSEIEIQRNF